MKPTNEFDYEAATMDEKVEYWHTHNTGDTLREFLKMSQDEYDAWMVSGKEPGAPLRKAIAIDFDGCLFHTEHMKIVSPNWDVINRSKGEKETGRARSWRRPAPPAPGVVWSSMLSTSLFPTGLLLLVLHRERWAPRNTGTTSPPACRTLLQTSCSRPRIIGRCVLAALTGARMGSIAMSLRIAAGAAVRSPMLGGRSGLPERANF